MNLGILPTKGLTLPLISSGGSSVLMTCVAMGVLLRVSYETDRAERLRTKLAPSAQAVGGAPASAAETAPADVAPVAASAPFSASSVVAATQALRGTSRMQPRVEPTFGRIA